MKKPKKKLRLFYLLGLFVVAFFAAITVFGDEGLLKLKSLYALQTQVQTDTHDLYLANQKLAREIAHLKDPVNSERLVREKLGYIKSNEYILILEAKSESQPKSPGIPSGF